MHLQLQSEYGVLKAVIVHRPGKEIDRLQPDEDHLLHFKTYLFEDLPYLSSMQAEHDEFTYVLHEVAGTQVLRFTHLLYDVLLLNEQIQLMAIERLIEAGIRVRKAYHQAQLKRFSQRLRKRRPLPVNRKLLDAPRLIEVVTRRVLPELSVEQLAYHLVTGLKVEHVAEYLNPGVNDPKRWRLPQALKNVPLDEFVILPSPNLYFMRDPVIVVGGGVIFSQMMYPTRKTDAELVRLVFEYHPLFQVKARGLEIWPAGRDLNPGRGEKPKTIEGGDVLVLNDHIVVIGQSERTTESAIQSIVEALFTHPASQRIDTVYQVNLPSDRTFMHLDTVMTLVDENLILVYEDAIHKLRPKGSRIKPTVRYTRKPDGTYTTEALRNTIIEELVELSSMVESLKGLQIIRVAAREQRSDAANVFVLGPRKVASYSRNTDTNHRLKERGVEVHKFNGPELLRGLGGPRCMTMPLVRSAFYYVDTND